jgi:hypothetical protein
MTSKFLQPRRILAATATITALLGGVAAAENLNYAPSACAGVDGAITVRSDGQIENRNRAAITVVCPAERNTSSTQFSGKVFVVDRSSSEEMCCRILTKNPGGSTTTGDEVCSSGASTGQQTLTLPGITDPYTWSHLFVSCTMPAASGSAYSRLATYRATQE